jgi:hypothetical protein
LGNGSGNGSGAGSGTRGGATIELYARRITECIVQQRLIPAGSNQINVLLGLSLLPVPPPGSGTTNNNAVDNLEADRERFHAVVEFCVSLIKDALEKFL